MSLISISTSDTTRVDRFIIPFSGPPQNGSLAGIAPKGALCIDIVTPGLWQNVGSLEAPVWQQVGSSSGPQPATGAQLAFNAATNSMYAPLAA